MSKRKVKELMRDSFGLELALGTISKIEKRVSEALLPIHEQVLEQVREAEYVTMDETTWYEKSKKAWLWLTSTSDEAYFKIAANRSSEVVTEILGDDFDGIASSDRAKAYLVLDPSNRQVCWFHLSRNFQSKVERGGQAATFGKRMRAFEKRLFKAEKLLKSGEIDEKSYQRRIKLLRGEVHRALVQWSDVPVDGIAGMCKNLLEPEPAL